MRIAMLSTPNLPVPPPRYGGTELVVAELCAGLLEAGHEVELFTCGAPPAADDPRRRFTDGAVRHTLFETPVWPPEPYSELQHANWALARVLADGHFDVVHAHVPAALPLGRLLGVPMVYTIHHARDEALTPFYRRETRPGLRVVAISRRQRELLPEVPHLDVVWHGLEAARYPFGPGPSRSPTGDRPRALFLGRLSREKGPAVALAVAARAGVGLDVAGKPHWQDRDYYEAEVAPLLGRSGSRHLGEVGHDDKVALLGRALATLCPVAWEEPFGLVLVESMLCGAPVLAFPRGAATELVEPGVTGWLCDSDEELGARLAGLADGTLPFDRARCRAVAAERFGRGRMVRDYLTLYARAAAEARREDEAARAAEDATRTEEDELHVVYP